MYFIHLHYGGKPKAKKARTLKPHKSLTHEFPSQNFIYETITILNDNKKSNKIESKTK